LKGYFDYYRKDDAYDDEDDEDDDDAYEIEEEGKRDYEPVELDVEINSRHRLQLLPSFDGLAVVTH
jgi:hypothetical protein